MKLNDSELLELLEQVATLRRLPILQICSRTVREMNLSESQFMALVKMVSAPKGAFVSTVADQLYIDTPKASRLVDSLVEANLVKRVYAKLSDRRKIQFMPTKEGIDTIEKIKEESMQTSREIFEDMGENTRELSVNLNTFNKLILSRMNSMKDK